MNIYDLPIPNFGELEDEAALKLILEVRSRRRIVAKQRENKVKVERKVSAPPRGKKFNSLFSELNREQVLELMEKLKS